MKQIVRSLVVATVFLAGCSSSDSKKTTTTVAEVATTVAKAIIMVNGWKIETVADLEDAILNGANLTGGTSAAPATTTTIKESPNWEYGTTGKPFLDSLNAFVAPFVQPVCDTLRQWGAPAETTKKEFNDFSKQVASLKRMIGSPSEPTFRDTYWLIYSFAEEALDYERRHPNDKYGAWTASDGPRECDRLNFTSANSKFGIK